MIRTIKLPYTTTPQATDVIAQWRQAQSMVIRIAYNRVREGQTDKDILDRLRTLPQGRLDSWLTLSALKRAKALHKAQPEKAIIFGGKRQFKLRAEGKITHPEWKAKRLLPLYFEGHAKSYGEQGGNHRFVLDISQSRVLFYPRAGIEFALELKLGHSNYRKLLEDLQCRCTWRRDTPFTVSLTQTHIAISWDEKPEPIALPLNPDRALALDLNPHRIGVAVLEKTPEGCQVRHWAVYDYAALNQKLGLASDHPDTLHQNNKRVYELAYLAKEIQHLALHYECATVVSENLNIETADHGKGKSFNRAVNNQWTRQGLIAPLMRRLAAVGLRHVEVNPAYSSKLGNRLWGWPAGIPDPACAAVEIGRRFLQEDPNRVAYQNGGNQRKEARQEQAPGDHAPAADARAYWKRIWNEVKPPQSGDTPRLTVVLLNQRFPGQCPSPSPFKAPSSRVVRFESTRLCHKLCGNIRKEL